MLDHKIIGYLSVFSQYDLLCDGDSCVIAGSEKKMKEYLAANAGARAAKYQIRKARFGDILAGLKAGAAYSFDEEAYNRFYPLAQSEGLNPGPEDFSKPPPQGTPPAAFHFVRVQKTATLK
jgi:hypothetical protein